MPNISVQSWTIEPAEDRYKKYRYHPKGSYMILFKSLKYLCKSVSNCIFWVSYQNLSLAFLWSRYKIAIVRRKVHGERRRKRKNNHRDTEDTRIRRNGED